MRPNGMRHFVFFSSRSKLTWRASTNRKPSSIAVLRLRTERQCGRQGWAQNWRLPSRSLFFMYRLHILLKNFACKPLNFDFTASIRSSSCKLLLFASVHNDRLSARKFHIDSASKCIGAVTVVFHLQTSPASENFVRCKTSGYNHVTAFTV